MNVPEVETKNLEELYVQCYYSLFKKYKKIMVLVLYTENEDLKLAYMDQIQRHHQKILNEPEFVDAGFDLFLPQDVWCSSTKVNKLDFQVKCAAVSCSADCQNFTGYYLYPRSSCSNTPLRLANSVGIIDAGYRGNIIGMFDLKEGEFAAKRMSRYAQICAPDLCPIIVRLAEKESELSGVTMRMSGGFGSTGA